MRKTLFAVLAFVLALLILTAACSPKDKPADDRKKPQESNSTMPDDPQKPGEPIFFYQVISREEIEEATGLKVLACREAKDSFGDKTGNRISLSDCSLTRPHHNCNN
jgi:hypothetical protein